MGRDLHDMYDSKNDKTRFHIKIKLWFRGRVFGRGVFPGGVDYRGVRDRSVTGENMDYPHSVPQLVRYFFSRLELHRQRGGVKYIMIRSMHQWFRDVAR